jgi:hypothetical protein
MSLQMNVGLIERLKKKRPLTKWKLDEENVTVPYVA